MKINLRNIISKLEQSVEDITALQTSHYPRNLLKINEVLGWGVPEEDLLENVDEVNEWVDKLKKLTPDTRKIFVIMLERSIPKRDWTMIPLDEVQIVTTLDFPEFKKHFNFLQRYGFIGDAYRTEEGNMCDLGRFSTDWAFWEELKKFTQKTTFSLDEIIVNLNFSVLD
ncbi:hypothetical protein NDK43_13860 [Neobacillus pocheonensis]|uniref:Uncharacterized protein n=1 Tax=Neobacillus pocheonensis TaxID=363869 RepID=A0ABT0WAC5_9BACI|nr:hypothetical protein [Neobacillus pocheonensis]